MLEQNWPLFSTNAWTSESFKVPSLKGLVFLVASSRIFVRYFFFCLKRKKKGRGYCLIGNQFTSFFSMKKNVHNGGGGGGGYMPGHTKAI